MIARLALILALALATGVVAGVAAGPAAAQSVYGCDNLAGRNALPAVEGADGVFYRIDPDMYNFHAFAPETVALMARLSDALAAQGTTLVYVPVPTKSMAMPGRLPPLARDLGHDPDLAATGYDDALRQMSLAGVTAVNLRRALRTGADGPLPFFQADYRMTPDGARLAAQAIAAVVAATPGFDAIPKTQFDTVETGSTVLPSPMRSVLQRHCMIALPPVATDVFQTNRFQALTTTGGGLFEQGNARTRIVLLGTEDTGGPTANLAGFLAQETGLDVVEYAVPGGGAFAAISTYLTSASFAQGRPAYLVWANPVHESLARTGDQPMRELIAAAAGRCSVVLPLAAGTQPNAIAADLRGLPPGSADMVFVDADGAQATRARFDFAGPDGLVRSRHVLRHADQAPTGRFYMPMDGLWSQGAQTVTIALDVPPGPNARVMVCAQ